MNSSWLSDWVTLSSTGVRRACSEMKSTSKLLKSFFDLCVSVSVSVGVLCVSVSVSVGVLCVRVCVV